MTVATSNVRTLIPFTGGNWQPVVENEVFAAIIKNPPSFWGLENGRFTIFDMTLIDVDEEDNDAPKEVLKYIKNLISEHL